MDRQFPRQARSKLKITQLPPLLAKHFTVFTYDRRGRNHSGHTAPYAVEREVEDLEALIKEAGGLAFVYGISSGAALALEPVVHLRVADLDPLGRSTRTRPSKGVTQVASKRLQS